MTRSNQRTPYSRPQTQITRASSRSPRNTNTAQPQASSSQPSAPLPHQVPGSRIQMMLDRSRGTTTPAPGDDPNFSPPHDGPPQTVISADDLSQFNFESHHEQELNTQINNALADQVALEAHSSQSSQPLEDLITSPTTASTHTLNHLTGSRLQLFNQMAARIDLDEQSLNIGRFMCRYEGQDEQFLACMVTVLAVQQDVASMHNAILDAIRKNPSTIQGSSPATLTWKADGAELKQCMRLLATQTILGGEVQAYTARVDPIGGTDQLPLGLYARVMSSLLSNPSDWKNRVLPPGYGTNPDPRHTRSLETALNNVLKEVRKSFDDVLLTNINLPNRVDSGPHGNVPVLDTVIVKLYQKERGLIGGRVRVREEILQEVDQVRTSRYAWLRMQAIHWGMNFADYEGRSFWNVVDRQLSHLRSQSIRYRYAFFLLVLQSDLERIDGTKTFEELRTSTDFSLPTETQIQASIDELNLTFGQDVHPDEHAYAALPVSAT